MTVERISSDIDGGSSTLIFLQLVRARSWAQVFSINSFRPDWTLQRERFRPWKARTVYSGLYMMFGSPGSLRAKVEAYFLKEMRSSEVFPSPVPRYRLQSSLRALQRDEVNLNWAGE